MLDKRNHKLYKSLRGEYRRYARRLKATLLDCCKGKDEINETLGDVFSMLAEAQEEGRPFEEIIPDPAASIRETALCFPARTMRRNTAFVLLLAGLAVLLCACGITIHLTSPIELDAVHDIDYDTEQRIASWEPVPHATEYQVYVNRKLYTTTTLNWTEIGRGTETDDTFYLQIVPVGSGRYQSPTKNAGAIIELDYPSVTLYFRDFDPWQDPHLCSWQGYYTAEQIHVTIVPTTSFYGRIQTDGDNARYLFMRSTAETDTQFQMEKASAISASDEPQTVSLARGWTLLRAEHSGALGQDEQITISADHTLRVGTLYYRNEHGAVPELTDQISFSADEAPLIDASAKSFSLRENETLYLIVYADEACDLQLQRTTQF